MAVFVCEDSLVLLRRNDIVNLEDHFDDLRGQFKLLLLGHHRLKDALFVHIHGSFVISVNAKERVVFSDLLFSQFGYVLDRVVARILSQSHRNFFQSVSKGSHGILFNAGNLIGFRAHGNRAGHLGGTTPSDDVIVFDHVTHDADGIVQATFSFVANCARTTTNHNCDGLGELAVLNKDHLVASCAKDHLFDLACLSELFRGDLFEARDDASASSNGEEFDLDTTDPANGGEFVLHEQVVGLVVETPLAENAVCARVFDALDHINEVVLLHFLESFVVSC